MKRILALVSVLVFFFALSVPIGAGEEEAKEVTLTGWITDQYCGAKNANANGAACARACAKKGSDMMIYSDGTLYKISDKELALQHVGYEVEVTALAILAFFVG